MCVCVWWLWFELQINKLLIGLLGIKCEVSELRQRQGVALNSSSGNLWGEERDMKEFDKENEQKKKRHEFYKLKHAMQLKRLAYDNCKTVSGGM